MPRFSQRPKRIARRTEKERFERSVMPAALICVPIGVALLIGGALAHLIYGDLFTELLVLGVAVFLMPLVFTVYRFMRGHFSRQLDEP
jgi:hypothetical protein